MVGEGLGIGFNRESYVMYMKKQENVRYYCMRNIDSATDFVLAYRKEMPVTGYMQCMIDMLMAHGRECEKIFSTGDPAAWMSKCLLIPISSLFIKFI